MRRQLGAWLGALWLFSMTAYAADYQDFVNKPFPIPEHYDLINDELGILRISHRVEVMKRLRDLQRRNGTQIVFLSVPNTGKLSVQDYAVAVANKWDIGNNGQGNGILFLFTNKGAHILTGPGISGAVPDVLLARIQRSLLMPNWERNEVGDGVEQVLDAMIRASLGEETMPTNYDYTHNLYPDKLPDEDRNAILLLCATAAAYAGWLLWRRMRRSKGAETA